MNESATGEFKSGEIEDFGPYKPLLPDEKYYNFFCQPNPLIINHGSSGGVRIVTDWGSEPIFDVQFGQNYQPKGEKRQVTIGKNNTLLFEYTKKEVDPPKRNVPHFISLKVRFGADGKEATKEKACRVIVKHDELPKNPVKKEIPVHSLTPQMETKTEGSTKTEPQEHPIQEEAPGVVNY